MKSWLRWFERIAWISGGAAVFYCAFFWARGEFEQLRGERMLSLAAAHSSVFHGDVVGRIEVPALGLSRIIFEGSDEATLARGVGHLQTSAMPGARGNVVLAGHRDTFFRSLENIEIGDDIVVTTPAGPTTYRVNSIRVVDPQSTYVLRSSPTPTITLITCYPFTYIGSAPKRYVIQGLLASSTPRSVAAIHVR